MNQDSLGLSAYIIGSGQSCDIRDTPHKPVNQSGHTTMA